MRKFWKILLSVFLGITSAGFVFAAKPLDAVINEIAWMGTENNSSDEWIELYNNTGQAISLENWGLYEAGGKTLIEPLFGLIEPKSYYLIERTDDATISDILASQKPSGWGGYGLKNTGEHLQILDQNSVIIDEIICSAGWFAGDNGTKQTMERKSPQLVGNNPENWQTSVESGGTPKSPNSKITETKITETLPLPTESADGNAENEAARVKPARPEPSVPSQNQLAAISKNLPLSQDSSKNGFKIFLIAFALAIFSGTTIFLLKNKTKID